MRRKAFNIYGIRFRPKGKQIGWTVSVRKDSKSWYTPSDHIDTDDRDELIRFGLACKADKLGTAPKRLYECIDAYHTVREADPTVDASTVEREAGEIKVLKQFFADVAITELRKSDIEAGLAAMASAGKSEHQLNKQRMLLADALEGPYADGEIGRNPAAAVKGFRYSGPDKATKERKRLTPSDLQAITMCIDGVSDTELNGNKVVIYVAIYTGMRRGEILGLNWADIDFDVKSPCIHVNKQYTQKNKTKDTKTGRDRVISMPDQLVTFLKRWKCVQIEMGYASADGAVCTNERGVRVKAGSFSRARERFFISRGLGHMEGTKYVGTDLHSIRRAHATMLLARGATIPSVQKRLGHTSAQTLLTYYVDADQFNDAISAGMVDSILGS